MNYTFNTFIKLFTFCTVALLVACSRNEKDAELFFIQGNVAYKKAEYKKAIDFFSEAIEKTPTFADAYNNRGMAKLATGNLGGAIADFEKAVSLDSDFVLAKYNLAEALSNSDGLDESISLLKSIEKYYKDSSFYYVTLSNALIQKSNFPEATQALQKALQLQPENDKALTNTGFIQYQQKEYNLAKQNFEKAIAINPKQDFALNNLSLIYANEGNFTKAIELVDKAIAINKSVLYKNNKGYYLLNTGKLPEGKQLIESALGVNNAWAIRNMGVYELLSKNYSKALANFEKAERLDPGVELINYYLGEASLLNGNKAKACQYWQTGAKLNESKSEQRLREVCK
ncbi:tetratricopeptide repeat protein [Emticicia sp. TH156]|uniref:tetratricopeptide repeat protein n=1 Tax=Emticicia sp. TH156 TaxID=2067454 RepID=UPI000C781AD6|nr:tetratricopeptide repeat protein [Emticicia sp. TH156]PLK44541.1 UDP-N-acetylglucosamine-peptide N-acetylglucosaminyltransferase [Emticicia sp. TH156]